MNSHTFIYQNVKTKLTCVSQVMRKRALEIVHENLYLFIVQLCQKSISFSKNKLNPMKCCQYRDNIWFIVKKYIDQIRHTLSELPALEFQDISCDISNFKKMVIFDMSIEIFHSYLVCIFVLIRAHHLHFMCDPATLTFISGFSLML